MLCTVILGAAGLLLLWQYFSYKRFWRQKSYNVTPEGRELGNLETMLVIAHQHNSLILSNTLFLRTKQPLSEKIIREAGRRLTLRHPALNFCVQEKDDKSFVFRWMKQRHAVKLDVNQDTDWKKAMEDQLLISFDDTNGPLWRMVFMPKAKYDLEDSTASDLCKTYPHESVVIFAFHHAIIDGPSYSRLFSMFLTELHNVTNSKETEIVPMEILPPQEFIISKTVAPPSMGFKIAVFIGRQLTSIPYIASILHKFQKKNIYVEKMGSEIIRDPTVVKRTCIIPVVFNKEETSNLLRACKSHGCTVQGLVQAGIVMEIVASMEKPLPSNQIIKSGYTVNTRPFYQGNVVPNEYLGAYFAFLTYAKPIPEQSNADGLWVMATDISNSIKKYLHDNFLTRIYQMFIIISQILVNFTKKVNLKEGERREDLAVFTNLGNCSFLDRDSDSDVMLRARFGCSGEHIYGASFANNLMTFNGQLFYTFVYYQNIVTHSTARKIADGFKKRLLEACQN